MLPTIKDVAKKASVSTATVSLVIHKHKRISERTRQKVLKAIDELKYRPSKVARGLVLRQTHNIGFLVTNDHFLRTEPFYTHIFLGTEFEARDHDYYILLNTVPSEFNKSNCLPRFVAENNIDGIIIAGKVPFELISCLEPYKLPLVFVDFYPPKGEYSAVVIDNINGGMQATNHLINLGHRNVGFIGGDIDHPSIKDRFRGYKQALNDHGIGFDVNYTVLTEDSMSREIGYQSVKNLLNNNSDITAIFASNDAMAIGAVQYLKEKGYNIPKDISLIGFDDVEADLLLDPPLSTIRVPRIDLGVKTMQLMVNILKDKKEEIEKIVIPVELVARDSTSKLT
jgi:LacI family transcriptional regulator